jgi:predicted aconitase with swiveling domain
MSTKPVLNYFEYIAEKANQDLAALPAAKGSAPSKSVDAGMAKLDVKGKSAGKSVKPEMADLPKGKGSMPSKSVKTGAAELPTAKGSTPKKSVDSKFANLVVKGSTSKKSVDPAMAKMPKK